MLLVTRGADVAVASRNVPLFTIRGITANIAERLEEESIVDARGLAMADPLRLFRNTNFGKRQILDWIDEALLITALPEGWQGLQRVGISGAVDLAYLTSGADGKCDIGKLAEKASVDLVVLECLSLRLAEDAQVALVWYLYQHDESHDDGDTPSDSGGPSSAAGEGNRGGADSRDTGKGPPVSDPMPGTTKRQPE